MSEPADPAKIARILKSLKERLGELTVRHQKALDELLTRIRERRLKELRDTLTHPSK